MDVCFHYSFLVLRAMLYYHSPSREEAVYHNFCYRSKLLFSMLAMRYVSLSLSLTGYASIIIIGHVGCDFLLILANTNKTRVNISWPIELTTLSVRHVSSSPPLKLQGEAPRREVGAW